jgi:predicted DNA-binding protein (UPF0251 family)
MQEECEKIYMTFDELESIRKKYGWQRNVMACKMGVCCSTYNHFKDEHGFIPERAAQAAKRIDDLGY